MLARHPKPMQRLLSLELTSRAVIWRMVGTGNVHRPKVAPMPHAVAGTAKPFNIEGTPVIRMMGLWATGIAAMGAIQRTDQLTFDNRLPD